MAETLTRELAEKIPLGVSIQVWFFDDKGKQRYRIGYVRECSERMGGLFIDSSYRTTNQGSFVILFDQMEDFTFQVFPGQGNQFI